MEKLVLDKMPKAQDFATHKIGIRYFKNDGGAYVSGRDNFTGTNDVLN